MAHFKTTQYNILGGVINRFSSNLQQAIDNDDLSVFEKEAAEFALAVHNEFVDQLCKEFANDNRLFNETLFRATCGNAISKTNVTQ